MKVTFTQKFRFSPNGFDIVEYDIGEHDVSDACLECAKAAGVLRQTKATAPGKNKSA